MIQVDLIPRQLEVDRPAQLVVRLTNVGGGLCTNLVMRIDLPVQVVLLRGNDRMEVPQLEAGASFTRTLRVKPLQVGTWILTSPNFSYQDPQSRARRIPDLRLGIQVVPAVPAVGSRPTAAPEPEQQRPAPQGIFISYRRDETGLAAVYLTDRLRQRFDRSQVFRDFDSIALGLDFRKAIGDALQSCAVALVLIGPTWAHMTDEQGRRRLDDPGDFVRVEVETVLRRDLPVIPVLVGGASMPRPGVLPGRLEQLVYRQAAALRDESLEQFELDLENLVKAVASLVPAQG
jgi:TIR domain